MSTAARQPIGFAHRAANGLVAFRAALAAGATGVEGDVRLTADGIPVLHHPGPRSLGRDIGRRTRADLGRRVVSVAELYAEGGNRFDLSLDMVDAGAADAIVRLAAEHDAEARLWLTYWRLARMREWHSRYPAVRLVYVGTALLALRNRERALSAIHRAGVDALNTHHRFCGRRLVRAAHANHLLVFAWGMRSREQHLRVLERGVDGVYGDDIPAMMSAIGACSN